MKTWPTRIFCGPHSYDVAYVERWEQVDSGGRQTDLAGQCDYLLHRIAIHVGADKVRRHREEILVTILHELIHALFHANHLLPDCLCAEAPTESFVDSLASALADSLVRSELIHFPRFNPEPTE